MLGAACYATGRGSSASAGTISRGGLTSLMDIDMYFRGPMVLLVGSSAAGRGWIGRGWVDSCVILSMLIPIIMSH